MAPAVQAFFGAVAFERAQMQEKEASFAKITLVSGDACFCVRGKNKSAVEIKPVLSAAKQPEFICRDMMEVGE